jgi:hypothetical protein
MNTRNFNTLDPNKQQSDHLKTVHTDRSKASIRAIRREMSERRIDCDPDKDLQILNAQIDEEAGRIMDSMEIGAPGEGDKKGGLGKLTVSTLEIKGTLQVKRDKQQNYLKRKRGCLYTKETTEVEFYKDEFEDDN